MAKLNPRHKEYWQDALANMEVDGDFERAFARVILTKLEGYKGIPYAKPLSLDLDYVCAALEAWDALDHHQEGK